ncbi:MAG: DUF2169 domain-containing protein [Pseudomonadota bacterium]
MKVYKPMLLGLSTRPIEHRKRFGLCISALLHFPFTEEATAAPTLWTEMSLWPFLAREMPQGPLIDEGVAKLTPEFLVHGHAFAPPGPDGQPATRCAVRASLGGVVKTLAVSGERAWVDGRATAPQPFDSMPLTWENAYGGADFAANPLGKGRRSADAPLVRLPNVEDLRHPVISPDSVPPPAGFGRVDPTWPQRARLRGTYDEAWYKDHAPGFAPDLDWRHFNLAPQDQWMPAPLVGDEPFTLEHMHATRRRIDGRLPGFKARCFAQYRAARPGEAQALREVPLRLTTVWFFPHAERGVLVFQGMSDIAEDDGSDITGLMGAVERLGEPRDDAHYAAAWERRQDPVSGGLQSLREADLLPAGLSSIDPEFEAAKSSLAVEGLQAQAQARRAGLVVDEARADAVAQGLDPDALGIRMPPAEDVPTLENLADYVAEKNALAQRMLRQDMEKAARQIREAEEEAEREGVAFPVKGRRGPPVYSAADHMKELLAAQQAEPAGDRRSALDALAPRLAQLEGAQRLAYLQGAHMQAPAPRLPAEAAARLRAQVISVHANRRLSLAGLDFTGADLSGLDLRGADLSEAWLESADLRGTNLSGALLVRAVLAHADLGGAIAIGTDFTAANLGGASFDDAVLDGANLSGAMLMQARLGNVHLRGARLAGANLLQSHWGAADCTDADAEQQNFIQLDLGASTWAGARLSRANFLQCRLEGVDFGGAQLVSANFAGCAARGVRMAGAVLAGASFVERCVLDGIDLQQARCDGTNFGETAMVGARLQGASLKGANLRLADLSDADLRRVVAIGALMTRTRMPRAQAQGANLMNAVLQNANLRGADLSHSNLHGADLSRVRLDGDTRIDGALITRTRIHPRLTPAQQAQFVAADAAWDAASAAGEGAA